MSTATSVTQAVSTMRSLRLGDRLVHQGVRTAPVSRVRVEDGEAHVLLTDGKVLVGPAYARVWVV